MLLYVPFIKVKNGEKVNTTDWSLFGFPRNASGKIAVLGIAYDSTSYLGKGTAAFPIAVRLASHGIEWESESGSVQEREAIDFGDLIPSPDSENFVNETKEFMDGIWSQGFRKFLVLGGNHSITIPVIDFLNEKGIVKKYLQFDAHGDAREEDRGTRFSFACTFRRISEILGSENCTIAGVRSIAGDEKDFLTKSNTIFGKSPDLGLLESRVKEADYISVDMDVFEHASVTNPEPYYGLTLSQVLASLSGKKVGFDIVEGIPQQYFGDDTATAGALLARKALFLLGDSNDKN